MITARKIKGAIKRLKAKTLCRRWSDVADGGVVFFTEPDHRPFDRELATALIDGGHVRANEDGLFPGMSQTFVVPA